MRTNCCSYPKIRTKRLYHTVMYPKDADGKANSVDPDGTAPLFAIPSACMDSLLYGRAT